MAYRNGNYCAFYVVSPFSQSSLGVNATKDFVYYNMMRSWKGKDVNFPFVDSHDKNYNVRDGSDWEKTLKPRLRDRLKNSKNIILFLSKRTKSSKALKEEIDYDSKESLLKNKSLKKEIKDLRDNLPIFRDYMKNIPILHVPMKKELITKALNDDLMINTKVASGCFYYSV
jgi:hypothetical protein